MLPRIHAVTDGTVLGLPDFLARAAQVAALGTRVAVHLRDRSASGRTLGELAERLRELLGPTGTQLVVNARPDIAAAVTADAVQLGRGDLEVADARRAFRGRIGRSVHGMDEARAAVASGADYLVAGPAYPTATHPGHPALGASLIGEIAALGTPVIAIGGITAERVPAMRHVGAHGVAAIRAIWMARDPGLATTEMLEAWERA